MRKKKEKKTKKRQTRQSRAAMKQKLTNKMENRRPNESKETPNRFWLIEGKLSERSHSESRLFVENKEQRFRTCHKITAYIFRL
ncbi:hypothetical protein NECAME_00230, partial [Necator americanus]